MPTSFTCSDNCITTTCVYILASTTDLPAQDGQGSHLNPNEEISQATLGRQLVSPLSGEQQSEVDEVVQVSSSAQDMSTGQLKG